MFVFVLHKTVQREVEVMLQVLGSAHDTASVVAVDGGPSVGLELKDADTTPRSSFRKRN